MNEYALAGLASKTASDVMSQPSAIVRNNTCAWEVVGRFLTGPARHVIVVDAAGRSLGVIGTRHLAGLWPLDPKRLKATPVESLGCASWISLSPDDDLRTCARTLTEHNLDAVPVLDAGSRVLGVVTARDITRALADMADVKQRAWQE
ncbi:CBS domain-containing protein [Actinocrinis puniceicyclus]|uniref:CBS domain-containing protein n=1 Tax=Actinocrinis puniceicyclus TaxID=977794 RepID=A0A8J7WPV7_9ACTN|nr:CBS domain-containing protein [Actinocrinis puniceicyclus]MBS2964167.1 CBS domain-containing protein [Actinocrinis puniceicyclus]